MQSGIWALLEFEVDFLWELDNRECHMVLKWKFEKTNEEKEKKEEIFSQKIFQIVYKRQMYLLYLW